MEKDRTGFIGSSDIAAILGLDPYTTILSLWAEKTGQIQPKDLSDNEAVEWGMRLEKIVAKKFADKHKVKLIAYKKRFVHPKYNFLTCELDTIIANTDESVEIKTCNAWKFKDWEQPDEIPAQYICQVMFALGLSNRKIGHIAVLVGGQRYIEKKIIFDQKVFDSMVEKAVAFWQNYVLTKIMPTVISYKDNDVLYQLFPNPQPKSEIQLGDDEQKIVENIQSLEQDKKSIEATIDQQKNILKTKLGNYELGLTNNYKIHWRPQTTRRLSIDTIKQKFPEIYEQNSFNIETRVLRISERKNLT